MSTSKPTYLTKLMSYNLHTAGLYNFDGKVLEMGPSHHAHLKENKQLVETLNSTLDLIGPVAKEVMLEILRDQSGISLSEENCSSKDDVKKALYKALGAEMADLLIREWEKRIKKAN